VGDRDPRIGTRPRLRWIERKTRTSANWSPSLITNTYHMITQTRGARDDRRGGAQKSRSFLADVDRHCQSNKQKAVKLIGFRSIFDPTQHRPSASD
jgi:hypothetical protein